MVGLHLLKHMDGLSDEAVCTRYLDSPYVQLSCGEVHFQHGLPLDRSSMTRWRQRIGAERLEVLRSEEHTSELQSRQYLVCRLLLEKKTTICAYEKTAQQ